MTRRDRIAHQITAVLRPQDIPDPEGEWSSVDYSHPALRGNVTKDFRTKDGIDYQVYFVPRNDGEWTVSFASEEDSKHHYEVIQNVAGIVRQFIIEHKPEAFIVSPTSKSRRKLYKAMFEKFLPEAELSVDPYGDLVYELPEETAGRMAVLRPDDIPFSEGEFTDSGNMQGFPQGSVIRSFTTSDGIDYDVYFTPKRNYSEEYSNIWDVSFSTDIYKEAEGESKHWYEVIQNVAGIVRQFIQEFDPSHFYASPTSESRRKLYKTMFKHLLPGAKLEEWQGALIYALPGAKTVEASRVAALTPEDLPEPTSPEGWNDYPFSSGRVISQTFQTSDEKEYKVLFKSRKAPGLSDPWDVVFIGDKSKHPYEVMQNVAAAIRDFIQAHNPSHLVMNPTTPSREKLYKTMMRRLLPEAVDKGWEKPLVYTLPESRQACRVAVLRPEEIPDPGGEFSDPSEDRYDRGMVTKNFTTRDGVEYDIHFRPRSWGSDRMWDVAFNPWYEGEQSEHHFEVIQNVAGITRQFIAEYDPTHLWIDSTSPSRRKLYMKMFKQFLPEAKFKPGSDALIYEFPGSGTVEASRVAVMRREEISEPEGRWKAQHIVGGESLSFTTSDGFEYKVSFWPEHDPDFADVWTAAFSPRSMDDSKKPFEVMRGVAGALSRFIRERNPTHIGIVPTSESRRKLYKTMFRRLLPESELVFEDNAELIYSISDPLVG